MPNTRYTSASRRRRASHSQIQAAGCSSNGVQEGHLRQSRRQVRREDIHRRPAPLNRIDPSDKEKRKKVNRLAEKLVECAIEDKQSWAFQQIADRLEGKPVQVVDTTVDDHRTLDQFSDAELTAILRKRVGLSLGETEERPEAAALN